MKLDPIRPTIAATDRSHYNTILAGLIRHAAGGDVKAFEQLYVATSRWMLARVRRITGDWMAEDVLAEVYLQVWRSLRSFDPARGEPLAWLMTIARTRALDRLRLERTSHGGQWDGGTAGADDEASGDPGPQEILELAQQRATVHKGLAALAPRERMVLALAYFGGCTQNEIASQTGFPLGSVKSLMTRSQQKLRGMFTAGSDTKATVGPQSSGGCLSAAP